MAETDSKPTIKPLVVLSPLHKAKRQISLYLAPGMEALGLQVIQDGHVLAYLAYYGPVSVGHVRKVFGYQPSTLTSVLNRMEKAGLVERRIDPEDRRTFLLEATAKGVRIGRDARRQVEQLEVELIKRVDAEALAGFRTVMDAIEQLTEVDLGRPGRA